MSGSLLPNGEQQFFNANGAPLAGGSVYFYVPGTTTPKQTWSNPSLTVLNANPVVLDSAGRAIIYGFGQYRQQVYDSNSNLIWDQLTASNAGFLSGIETPGNYTVSAADAGMLILPSGGATVTLPSASSVNDIALSIASVQSAGATVTLSGGTLIGGNLSGSTSVVLGYGSWLSVVAYGTNNEWVIVSASGDITSAHGFFASSTPGTSSWTAPTGVRSINYIVTGGGGGGSDSVSTNSSGDFSGGGGGAGGTVMGQMSVTPGQSLAYTVGAGGTSQSNGGTSSLNGVSAGGGSGTDFQSSTVSSGGAGGSSFSGSYGLAIGGGYGCDGQSGTYVAAGMGGASFWGGGGKSVFGGNGLAGQAWGSGGGGAQDGAFSGGAGASGVVVITW